MEMVSVCFEINGVVGVLEEESGKVSRLLAILDTFYGEYVKSFYLTGEYGDNDFIVVRGDSRISLTLAKDEYSIQLNRNNRFLIDDYDSKNVLAYRLTKPFKLGGSYNGEGVLNFVLTECNTEDSDNIELHIANYYDHFPKEKPDEPDTPSGDNTPDVPDGKKVWL